MDNEPGPSKKQRLSVSPSSPDGSYKSVLDKGKDEIYAANFKRDDLDSLNIFYDKDPTPVADFFRMVKQKRKRWTFPEEAEQFVKMTTDRLRFSLNVDEVFEMRDEPESIRGASPWIFEREMLSELDHAIHEFNEFQFEELNEKFHLENSDKLYMKLFLVWSTSVDRFLSQCKDLIQKLAFPPPEFSPYANDKKQMDGKSSESILFVQTFQRFSEMCFLVPTPSRKRYAIYKTVPVSSDPDLCFIETTILRGKINPTLFIVSEVERYANKTIQEDDGESWIEKRLSSENMGQVGAELLTACFVSSFRPNVLGIVCVRTKVIFVLLDITEEHLRDIRNDNPSLEERHLRDIRNDNPSLEERHLRDIRNDNPSLEERHLRDIRNDNPSLEERHAAIHYTKSYDIMKAEDRDQFIEMMFYLGCMQKDNLRTHFLNK